MNSHQLTISLAQMDCRLGEPEANEAKAEAFITEAAHRGSDLVLLPELWRSGYDLTHGLRYAAPLGTGPFAWLAGLARTHGIWIGSSLLEAREGEIFNTATLFSAEGELAGVYRKTHLFGLMEEDLYLAAGNRAPLLDLGWGPTALAICYDLRFPELFRRYAVEGATLILLPAQWPRRRVDAWRTLLRARAAKNQLYMVGCNRVGCNRAGCKQPGQSGDPLASGTPFGGHSAVIDPWGNTVIEGGESELLLTAVIDMDKVAEVRAHMPVFRDRRPDVYGTGW
ncbi:MAG TPA: carbon-nitrogen family hydrolase [Anaerolineae bacterium]|nr:carbon-nitrogen family hydrolase [Anaerolineae bacterium]